MKPREPEAGRSKFGRRARLFASAALVLLVALAFYGALANGFTSLDDPLYVTENPHVLRGLTWDGVRWALTAASASNWHPLTWIAHMLDVSLWGTRALGHHLTSVVIHAANVVLLFRLLERLVKSSWPSLVAAALFAVHPLRVESVAWVAERKDVLAALFFLLALHAYLRWRERGGAWNYGLLALLYLLGLLAKPMLVTLPFVLLLLDAWPLARLSWQSVREKLPLFALAAFSCFVTYRVQAAAGAVATGDVLPFAMRATHAVVSYAHYLRMTAWPADLAVYYPHPGHNELVACAIALVILVALSIAVVRARQRSPALTIGWLWYLGTLVPVIGFIQVGSQAFADRYTYIPTMGLCLMLAGSGRGLWVACALTLPILVLATQQQVRVWRDSVALFTSCIERTHDNALAEHHLGSALLRLGDREGARKHLNDALRIQPNFPDSRNDLGTILGDEGHLDEAIALFEAELALHPASAETHTNLGYALVKQGKLEAGIAEYRAALKIDPDSFQANKKLGAVLGGEGKIAEAFPFIAKAVAAAPDDIEARRTLAVSYSLLDDPEQSVATYKELLRRDPNDLDALYNIALVRATHAQSEHRNAAEAVRFAEQAVKLCPRPEATLEDTLAAAYAEAGRFDEAVAACTQAIALARAAKDEAATKRYEMHLARLREGKPLHMD